MTTCVTCRGVRERTAEDVADADAFPFDEEAEMKSLGALGPHGEEGFSTLERRCARQGGRACFIHCLIHVRNGSTITGQRRLQSLASTLATNAKGGILVAMALVYASI